ncbi:MAG: hypothetical protein ACYCPS_02460 [Candidatus Saccharimonadales bacterium]
MPSHRKSFEALEQAIDNHGTPYKRADIVIGADKQDEVVARGIERDVMVSTEHPIYIAGNFSVRALMGIEAAVDPFGTTLPEQKWLLRARLTFYVPRNRRRLEVGHHLAGAVYILSANAPQVVDDYFDLAPEQREETVLDKVASTNYYHNLPGLANTYISPDSDSSRTLALRRWIGRQSGICMEMLSPTSDGQISAFELPNTISWLLEQNTRTN